MTIVNSNVASQVVKQTQSEAGTLHLFNHLAVIEFNEGYHIDKKTGSKILKDIINYFGTTNPFGVVANRINSYSVSTLDIKDVKHALPNLAAYGIVSYNDAGKMSAQIESEFCERKDICFDNLYDGLDTIYKRVKERITISLN